jgi:hypothetical protein
MGENSTRTFPDLEKIKISDKYFLTKMSSYLILDCSIKSKLMKNAPSSNSDEIKRDIRMQINYASNSLFIYSKRMDKLMEIFYEVAEGQGFQSVLILENPSLTQNQAREVYQPIKDSSIKQKIFTIDYVDKKLIIHTNNSYR